MDPDQLADLGLGKISEGKEKRGQRLLDQLEKEVDLIAGWIGSPVLRSQTTVAALQVFAWE